MENKGNISPPHRGFLLGECIMFPRQLPMGTSQAETPVGAEEEVAS